MAGTPISASGIPGHLERDARKGFLKGENDYRSLRGAFVREVPSNGAFETYVDMGDLPWPVQNAGKVGAAGTDSRTGFQRTNALTSGGLVTIVGGEERGMQIWNVDYEIAIGIYQNAIDDSTAPNPEEWARGARASFEEHKDFLAFDFFEKGDGNTYGIAFTGQNFFANAHTYPGGAEYTTAQDNLNALALSDANYKTVVISGSKFLNSRGNPMGLQHNLLLHPVDLISEAFNIAQNEWVSGSGNRTLNPFKGRQRLEVPGTWFNTTAWVVVATNKRIRPVLMQMRKQPELVTERMNMEGAGGLNVLKWHERLAVGAGHPLLAIMGNT